MHQLVIKGIDDDNAGRYRNHNATMSIGLEKFIRYGLLISSVMCICLFIAIMMFSINPMIYAIQSLTTINGIKVLCVLLPGIMVLGSWASFKFLWNMDDDMRRKVDEFKAQKNKS